MRSFFKGVAWIGGTILVIMLGLYLFLYDAWTVHGDDERHNLSILPTLSSGDVLLLAKEKGDVKFGWLVRCDDPEQSGRYIVGRVYGLPHDKVVFESGLVTVNGKREPSPRACDSPKAKLTNPANGLEEEVQCAIEESAGHEHPTFRNLKAPTGRSETTVEGGRIYLVSDNRHFHLDSRDFGALSPSSCKHIVIRLWSQRGWMDSNHRMSIIW